MNTSRPWAATLTAVAILNVGGCDSASTPNRGCAAAGTLSIEPRLPPALPAPGATLALSALDGAGIPVTQGVTWSSRDEGVARVSGGSVTAVRFGVTVIEATCGGASHSIAVSVADPGEGSGMFRVVGRGGRMPEGRIMTDVWVQGDLALTGSGFHGGCGGAAGPCPPASVTVWDVSNPAAPTPVRTISTPAAIVNDVKISGDGRFAVATQEAVVGGIVILDLADPSGVRATSQWVDGAGSGVHNAWIERIRGTDYVFLAARRAGVPGTIQILDLSDLEAPRLVASYSAGSSVAHDVYVRDGLAFVSHWDDGLSILDVGHGIRGGSPEAPVEVSRLTLGGQTHNAWYWPERRLVFVGREYGWLPNEPVDSVGAVFVVDVADLASPRLAATYRIPGMTPHNFWVDEERGVLFVAWYGRGLRALDVSGPLEGTLAGTVIELGAVEPPSEEQLGFWGPQLVGSHVFVSDMRGGLWVFEITRGP
jgi:hypothetical protein